MSTPSQELVSVLIVSWNTRDLLRLCLQSLLEHASRAHIEIVVLDNNSHDGSAAMVREQFSTVTLFESAQNLGFARGNNEAFKKSSGGLVWLLNPDTQVLPGALDALLDRLERDARCGAVASALIDARDGHTQRSCRTFPTAGAFWGAALWAEALGLARAFPRSRRYGFYRLGHWSMREARIVEQPMASSLLLRRTAIEEASKQAMGESGGLFDEQFPIFFNDVDLCRRVMDAGWSIWFEPASRVLHWGGASTSQARRAMIAESHASLEKYLKKNRESTPSMLFWSTIALVRIAGVAREARARLREVRSLSQVQP